MQPDPKTLAKLTTFGVGGPPTELFRPRTRGDVLKAAARCRQAGRDAFILGGGSNLLVDDAGPGAPVIATRELSLLTLTGEAIHAGAGVSLARLVRLAARSGLSGLETLAGIPGTLGGALTMNAGGAKGCIGDVTESVEFVDRDLNPGRAAGKDLAFGYRRSSPHIYCITAAVLNLRPSRPDRVLRETRRHRQKKRNAQPLGVRSAGCFFKNPGSISAGFLIDRAGLKGFSVGDAQVSEKHANFIINRGRATCLDIVRLAEFIVETVKSVFRITLEPEVKLWRPSPEWKRSHQHPQAPEPQARRIKPAPAVPVLPGARG